MEARNARRKPWLAGLLSLVVSGLGHLYAGRPRLAGAVLLLSVAAGVLIVVAPLFLPQPTNVVVALVAVLVMFVGVPLHAAEIARAAPPTYALQSYNRWYVYLGLYCISGFVLSPWIYGNVKTRLVEAFRAPSGSMEPTIQTGDYLYVAKWKDARTDLRPGTVVVFESVEEPGLKVVKRVVGVAGDTLAMDAGTLYRNGQPQVEPYTMRLDPGRSEDPVQRAKMQAWQSRYLTSPVADPYRPDLEQWGPFVVPADSVFVLGDNRDASYDSRYYGFIPRQNVLGQPRVVYFSYDGRAPGQFLSRVRWARLGRALR
jgi:signal peptidase I